MSGRQGRTVLATQRVWHHASADGRILGKLASRIAWVLMGKHKPTYDPSNDRGDYVVVEHASKIHLTGRKATDKKYFYHSGFPGGEKWIPITRLFERRPDDIIRRAVSGMLPKNTFRQTRLKRLRIYADEAPKQDLANVTTSWRQHAAKSIAAQGTEAKDVPP